MALLGSSLIISSLDCGYIGVFVAQARAPILSAITGGIYVLKWSGKQEPHAENQRDEELEMNPAHQGEVM